MKKYIIHLEDETLKNIDYRRVLHTREGMQLVVMSLPQGVEIGEETHSLDQFIRIEKGVVTVFIEDEETELHDGDAIIIPRGTKHNFINRQAEDVKLYTIYAPPEHKDGTVEHEKSDEHEEHWDGVITSV